jgi:hypothetical protein
MDKLEPMLHEGSAWRKTFLDDDLVLWLAMAVQAVFAVVLLLMAASHSPTITGIVGRIVVAAKAAVL